MIDAHKIKKGEIYTLTKIPYKWFPDNNTCVPKPNVYPTNIEILEVKVGYYIKFKYLDLDISDPELIYSINIEYRYNSNQLIPDLIFIQGLYVCDNIDDYMNNNFHI